MQVEAFLKDAVGEYQDRGRDDVPPGYVWALKDFLPRLSGATLRGRGATVYVSQALANAYDGLAWVPFNSGGKLIGVALSTAYDIPIAGPTAVAIGAVPVPFRQNPFFYREKVFFPSVGFLTKYTTSALGAPVDLPASSFSGGHITAYRDRLVIGRGNTDALSARLAFAKPGDPTLAWDAISYIDSGAPIFGLRAMRNSILIFHENWVEQLRGTTPPDSSLSDPTGDMSLGTLWEAAGCRDARSIAGWQENVIFADERGVHITDGGLVRNMIEQGGMSREWRAAFEATPNDIEAVSGTVYGNLYLCTVKRFTGTTYTWLCDVPTRRWWRWTNIGTRSMATVSGSTERVYAADTTTRRAMSLEKCFKPDTTVNQVDANGVNVLPEVETAWSKVSHRSGLRRIFNLFVDFLGYRLVDPGNALVNIGFTTTAEDATYEAVDGLGQQAASKRRKVEIFREVEGVGFRIQAAQAMADFRINGLDIEVEALEPHRVK